MVYSCLQTCQPLSSAFVGRTLTIFCVQAALQMDIEDINAYCQRQDALALLKRIPPARRMPLPVESEQVSKCVSQDSSNGAAVA